MGKDVSLTSVLIFLILVDVTNASLFENYRKLSAQSPKVSPNPSSAPGSSSTEDKSKDKHDKGLSSPPIGAKEEGRSPKNEVQNKEERKSNLPSGDNESCDGIEKRCHDTKSMIACIKNFNDASKALVFILNEGDSNLKVDLTVLPLEKKRKVVDIPQHQSTKVNILLAEGGSNEIILNAGYGDCLLYLGSPTSQGNYFQWLPSYSKYMTPVYGAYFVLLTTIIAGVVWACCWFRKRKGQTDIQYQELEMSMPESAVPAETAEGWDQDWDDDWDEERAVKSPGDKNISANGLTSRTQNKDGSED